VLLRVTSRFALWALIASASFLGAVYANADTASAGVDTAPWQKAISNDDVDKLRLLLSGSNQLNAKDLQALINATAPNGKTALMVASKKGDMAFAKKLLQAGAPVNSVTKTGGNAFMFAVLGNHYDTAVWLESRDAYVAAVGSNGWSAVTIAAAMGHTDLLKWLTSLDTPVDKPDVYRFTPLMRAADNGHYLAAKLLLDSNEVNINAGDEWQNTALHFVVANKNSELLELLLQRGADIQKANRDGITPASMMDQWPEAQAIVDRHRQ